MKTVEKVVDDMNILLDVADKLQDECHAYVEDIMKKSNKVSYQDATNTWFMLKLAQLQLNQTTSHER